MRFFVALALLTLASVPATAGEPVSIQLRSRVLASPADLRLLVLVEPDAANRRLTIEIDGVPLFRSSDVTLEGEREKRAHQFEVKGLMPGEYVIRAVLHGSSDVRAVRERNIIVFGPGMSADDIEPPIDSGQ